MILFFGPPGSGKSVQGQLLVARNHWQWLSTGQLFRDSNDPEVMQCLATGELIDDELTNKVVETALLAGADSGHIVLDGYPRTTDQAKWLGRRLPAFKRRISAVVVFKVPDDELIKRLAGRGRAEDSTEVIQKRLQIYREQTQPIIDYYTAHDMPVHEVDGTGSVGAVHDRIQAVIEETCSPL